MTNIVDIGPECFADEAETVISYKGSNYYKACGVVIIHNPEGGTTSCVKRVNHPTFDHEDFYGNILVLKSKSYPPSADQIEKDCLT